MSDRMSTSGSSSSSSSPAPSEHASGSGSDSGSESDSSQSWNAPSGFTVGPSFKDMNFDWQTVLDSDDLEIWAIRCPANLKPRHLEGINGLELAKGKGRLRARKADYEVLSRRPVKKLRQDGAKVTEGEEEMDQLRIFLPRKEKNGSLWCMDEKPISRNIIIRQTFEPEAEVEEDNPMSEDETVQPKKRQQPKEFTYSLHGPPSTLALSPAAQATQSPMKKSKKDGSSKKKKHKAV